MTTALILFTIFYFGVSLFIFLYANAQRKNDSRAFYVWAAVAVCLCWAPLFFLLFIKEDELAHKFVNIFRKTPIEECDEEETLIVRLEKRGF